jgi:hypothetical protein
MIDLKNMILWLVLMIWLVFMTGKFIIYLEEISLKVLLFQLSSTFLFTNFSFNKFLFKILNYVSLKIKQLVAEFVFVEDNKEKIRLNDVKVGSVDGLNVKVNIPESITRIGFIKQMMQYVISRITTMIANRSKDSITRNMQKVLMNAIKEKTLIKP